LKTLNKRILKKTKEKDINFNIKMINNTINNQITKNNKMDKKKKKKKQKKKKGKKKKKQKSKKKKLSIKWRKKNEG